ncbi:MAG: dihydrofolate reductase [Alphaproteobacteria bacterium]
MKLTCIVAVDEDFGIGCRGELPWYVPRDLKYVRKNTIKKAIFMGRATYESLPKPLPDRVNIVLTSKKELKPDFFPVASLEQAINVAQQHCDELVIFGGSSIYKQFLQKCDRLLLTIIHHKFEADVRFPPVSLEGWELVSNDFCPLDKDNPYNQSYLVLDQKHSGGSSTAQKASSWDDIRSVLSL